MRLAELSGAQVQAWRFDWRRSQDQRHVDAGEAPAAHRVVVVGAGPVGLSLAIDLAQRGQPVLLIDADQELSHGSRAICFAQRTLQIWDRLGVGDACVERGVRWQVGKVFLGADLLYRFDLQPEPGHERPAFINLQQYYAEAALVERAQGLGELDLRWGERVVGVQPSGDGVRLHIQTPQGEYAVDAEYVVACDGARSGVRALLGLESQGQVFHDRFLIADVHMRAAFPAERWFWFDPPFHPGKSVLLHRQPDDVWRIDFQLGWDADPEVEKRPERIVPRVQAMLEAQAAATGGIVPPFELAWASVYTFACQRMAAFRHGRVFFAGDAAHGVSPFGARGANSGVQDAENLAWKLAAALSGQAGDALLASYGGEREPAADENLAHSTRSTDFITPKSAASRVLRDAALALAREHAFARALVNSGRLSTPTCHGDSPLNSADDDDFTSAMRPGAPALDAPLRRGREDGWLLRALGADFTLLVWGSAPAGCDGLPLTLLVVDASNDSQGLIARRYDMRPGSAYLLRPDQHVCARWRHPTPTLVRAALARARGQSTGGHDGQP